MLTREYACSNCGFGFCSNCVKFRAVVPGKGKDPQKVCGSCQDKLKHPEKVKQQVYAMPEALQRRLDAQQNSGGGPPVIINKENRKMSSLRRGLSADDQKIADRLEKLQKERREKAAVPTDSDITARLSKLKGEQDPMSSSNQENIGTPFYKPPDKRSDVDKTKDLLESAMAEVKIDSTILTPEQDIANRLAKLRGQDPNQVVASFPSARLPDPSLFISQSSQNEMMDMDLDEVAKLINTVGRDVEEEAKQSIIDLQKDKAIQEQLSKLRVSKSKPSLQLEDGEKSDGSGEDEDEIVEVERITKQLLEEQLLEERLEFPPSVPEHKKQAKSTGPDDYEPEELPWCVICNDDASIRCRGCDDDLYCRSCFKEFHDGEDSREHKPVSFSKR